TVSLHQGFRLACLMMLTTSAANSYALGTATPTDIPGVLILDAHVSADYVNNITVGPAGNPPFAPGTEVNKLQTTQPFIAIRSYYTPYDSSKSGQAGGWISPIAEVRGLSRAELLSKLALPINPDGTRNNTFALVMVPSGVSFWSGPAGPITSSKTPPVGSYWGAGGGIQYYVGRKAGDVPGFQVPLKNYVLAAPMGETNLLAYSPSLSGNAHRVGQYLDGLSVQAYSDLDRVLTTLDMINLSAPAGDQKLQQVIGQLGAERYGALGLASLYQARLFMDRMSEFSGKLNPAGGGASVVSDVGNLTWMQTQGARAKQSSDADRTGFTQTTTMLVAGTETKYAENWKLGVAAAYLFSNLDWANSAPGDGELKTGYLGGYATYRVDDFRATGQVFLGYSRIDTRRNINIPDAGLWPGYSFAIDRIANGSTEVKASGIRLDITQMATLGQTKLAPFIGIDYQHFARGQFTETGAGSTNLQVQSKNMDDLRLRLGVSVEHTMGRTSNLDWSLHSHLLTAHRLSGSSGELVASFEAQNSSFSSNAWRSPKVLNQAGIGMTGRGQTADFALNYNYEQGSGFAASTLTLSADWRF
ncbi:autotransporter outer membrane beta-barrel domain-containing protein, partial [Propionivibrio sp.]|uniref:autotransporter outer membrane beta-barrel domain-containing protein n=1 Tax=Propionivibrio sp. TaxID=2212460 RepID=UPI003BF13F30